MTVIGKQPNRLSASIEASKRDVDASKQGFGVDAHEVQFLLSGTRKTQGAAVGILRCIGTTRPNVATEIPSHELARVFRIAANMIEDGGDE